MQPKVHTTKANLPFSPSSINQDGAHIPGYGKTLNPRKPEEMILDAELFEALFDDAIDTEAEPVQIPTVAPQPQREHC